MLQNNKNWVQILITRVSGKQNIAKYQLFLFINFALKWMIAGMALFSLNFFYVLPEFQCSKQQLPINQTCQQYVCKLDQSLWSSYFKKPIRNSISIDYGIIMMCQNSWISSLLQSTSYLGSFIGYMIMSYLADNQGRKKSQLISWIISILGLILLICSINLQMIGIGSFLMGFGLNSSITLHYTLIKQFLIGKMRQRSFLILQVMFSIGVGLIAFLSMFIYNWKIIAGVFLLIPAILILPYSLYIIQQSPNFLLKKGKITLLNSLNKIAKINNNDQLQMQDLDIVPQKDPLKTLFKSDYTLLDLFKNKSLLKITIITGLMDCIIQFIYDGTILSLDKLGFNVYIDQILVGLVQITASITCSYIIVKMKRKKFMKICLILISFFTLIIGLSTLLFQHKNNELNLHVIIQMIFLAFLRFMINTIWGLFFVYVSQLFPNNVLSIAFGWVSAVGTVGAVASPFIRLLTANATLFIMSILCVISIPMINMLHQTKDTQSILQITQRVEQQNNKKQSVIQ